MAIPSSASRRRQGGFILVLMALSAIALLAMVGLAVDVGRVFVTKNEAQAHADAAALAAALQLNGTTAGLTDAFNAVTSTSSSFNFSSTNKWNLNNCSFLTSSSGCTVTAPVVEVATASSGATWYAAAGSVPSGSVANIRFVRVTTSVNLPIFFVPIVMTNRVYSQTVKAQAMAGQVDITSFPQGLAPFAGIGLNTSGPNFGYTIGAEYDIQWPQYNSSRKNCGNGHGQVMNCFVKSPCAGDVADDTGTQAAVQHWGASINGYWGSPSASNINDYIIGTQQLTAVAVGTDLQPSLSSGNKQSTAQTLDDRVNSDPSNLTNDLTTYLADSSRNGRRLIVVPVVNPSNKTGGGDQSPVLGYATFFLRTDATTGRNSQFYKGGNGNDPYCAIYAGSYTLGGFGPGVGGSTGASRVKLVQ